MTALIFMISNGVRLLHLLQPINKISRYGAVAQLGERRVRNAKVGSSILLRSTNLQRRTKDRLASSGLRSSP
jgi:hypothetical protein